VFCLLSTPVRGTHKVHSSENNNRLNPGEYRQVEVGAFNQVLITEKHPSKTEITYRGYQPNHR